MKARHRGVSIELENAPVQEWQYDKLGGKERKRVGPSKVILACMCLCCIGLLIVAWDLFRTKELDELATSSNDRPFKTPQTVVVNAPVDTFDLTSEQLKTQDINKQQEQQDINKQQEQQDINKQQAQQDINKQQDQQDNSDQQQDRQKDQQDFKRQVGDKQDIIRGQEPIQENSIHQSIEEKQSELKEFKDDKSQLKPTNEHVGMQSEPHGKESKSPQGGIFKIEPHWFDAGAGKVRFRKDYISVVGKALKERGMRDSYSRQTTFPPGFVPPGVSLIWGVHWENVFSEQGNALPRHHKNIISKSLSVPSSSQDAFRQLERNVTVNMIPGVVKELCSKVGLIRAKASAAERFSEDWVKNVFALKSLVLTKDNLGAFRENCTGAWAVKPQNSAEGTGIRIFGCDEHDHKELSSLVKHNDWVAQEYVLAPFLSSQGLKFDLRTWMLVTSIDPVRMYVVRDAHFRFASEQYSPESSSFRHQCMHLTNGMVQKRCEKLQHHHNHNNNNKIHDKKKRSGEHQTPKVAKALVSSFWSQEFKDQILRDGLSSEQLWESIEDLMVRSVLSVVHKLRDEVRESQLKAHAFQLLSFDIILDGSLPRPVLLEVNPDGYLKKGFQRVTGGWNCTKSIVSFLLDAQPPSLEAQNAAERVCRRAKSRSLVTDLHSCKKLVAHHLAETTAYENSCWHMAFPTRARRGLLPMANGDRDAILDSAIFAL